MATGNMYIFLLKFGHVTSEIREWSEKQTDTLIAVF